MTQPSQGGSTELAEVERRGGFRLLVHGAAGRLGKVIVEIARSQTDLTVKGAGRADPIEQLVPSADVVVDVTAPAATTAVARLCSENQKPLIVGTTGHNPEQIEALHLASRNSPVLLAPNFSLGVTLLFCSAPPPSATLLKHFTVQILH